jgi:uncharacterized protein YjiS (DUF1127 family)
VPRTYHRSPPEQCHMRCSNRVVSVRSSDDIANKHLMECIMSDRILAEVTSTFIERRSLSWRPLRRSAGRIFHVLFRIVGTRRSHRRQRRELFEFLASDHRAAADIGITRYYAGQSFDWPFRN